ncbi:MAG TPA: ATP-dependent Clp protease ATP-binding subunit, partial [Planctomycetota bacterium]|nr:ATP-dependent Clp protease ATP-binding subunit [Planctomycetota bacterium]
RAREKQVEVIREELQHHFRPEFLNRLDAVVTFDFLDEGAVRSIFHLEFAKVQKRLVKKAIQVEITPEAMEFLITAGYTEKTGARGLRRIIEERIEDPLSEMIILAQVHAGDVVRVDLEGDHIHVHALEAHREGK